MTKRAVALLLCIGLGTTRVWAVDVEDIPSPRPAGWVTDLTGTLQPGTIARLNTIGDEVHRRDGAELAVVVVETIDGRRPRAFATRLFNHWGIGDVGRDNGVLVFAALGDRKAEIILGDGVDSAAEVRTAERIMSNGMVPAFRRNDVDGAVLAGATGCAVRILGVDPERIGIVPRGIGAEGGDVPNFVDPPPPRGMDNFGLALLCGAGIFGGTIAGAFGLSRYARYRARTCQSCGRSMTLLGESADDAHLDDPQRTEERIGSVDYDVWSCPTCDEVRVLRFGAFFTRYSRCPQCGYATKASIEKTLQAATTASSGLAEVSESCKCCDYRHTSTRVIPMIQHSSSSSSGFSSSGFGGGSSSGGGASGSW